MNAIHRVFLLALTLFAAPLAAQDNDDLAHDASEMARFKDAARIGMFSSYDPTGGNNDGFSGDHSYIRKEGEGLVIAELEGAGVLTRIWTPTPLENDIEFYIDGAAEPTMTLPFADLFSGRVAPFQGDLVGTGVGGYYSYVPIRFNDGIKVVIRAERVQFFQINYKLYEESGNNPSFSPDQRFALKGPDLLGTAVDIAADLASGETLTLFDTDRPGRIKSLRLYPAERLASAERDIDIRITWDGSDTPAIDMPVTEFYAHSFG